MTVQIYHYRSYRDFLRDLIEEKRVSKKLSYRYFARKCGFKRPNYFQSILTGERNLTAQSAIAVAKGLKLNSLERSYFETLVQLAEAQDDKKLAQVLDERLDRMKRNGLAATVLGVDAFDSYLLPVIWEMFQLSQVTYWTVDMIRQSLLLSRVSKTDIERTLQKLKNYGLISDDSGQGFTKNADAIFIGPEEDATENGMRQCHRIALRHAAQALDLDVGEREMQNLVIAIAQTELPAVKSRIRDFLATLNSELTGAKGVDQVVQIHFSVVPLNHSL